MKLIPGVEVKVIPPDCREIALPSEFAGQRIAYTFAHDSALYVEFENRYSVRVGLVDTEPLEPGRPYRMAIQFGQLLADYERPPLEPGEAELRATIIGRKLDAIRFEPNGGGVYLEFDHSAGRIPAKILRVNAHGIEVWQPPPAQATQ